MYRHGLRASEAKHTKWTDIDLTSGSVPKTFHVRRLKGSNDSTHTLDISANADQFVTRTAELV